VGEAEEARHDVQVAERKHAELEKILDEVKTLILICTPKMWGNHALRPKYFS
jgi:hypothetical protein